MAIVNIAVGYALAAALAGASGSTRQLCDDLKNSTLSTPRRSAARNSTPITTKNLGDSQSTHGSVTELSVEENEAMQLAVEEAATKSCKLSAIQDKLSALRSFGDKSIARSLSEEVRYLAQSQASLWEKAIDGRHDEDTTQVFMQKLALSEAMSNDIDQINWNGSLDEVVDMLSKQVSMFARS